MKISYCLPLLLLLLLAGSCKKENTTDNSGNTTKDTVPSVYKKIYGASDLYVSGDYVYIKCTGLPDHKSPYYQGTQWSAQYEAYNGSNTQWSQNPNKIASFNYTFKIPLNPKVNVTHSATPGGPIGVAINGIPLFNQYAAGGSPLSNELNSFDQYNGHPQQQGGYHYHAEPFYLTTSKGKTALIGFLLDGFPVYGPTENGNSITNADLDKYHGHTTATADYPNGIYHYHVTDTDPYINGSGFYGTPGTVTN